MQMSRPGPKLEAVPGERRVVRTITYPGPDGSLQTRTIVYTDKDKIATLNSLFGKEGFGQRTIRAGED